jgi:hypothetical protein
MILGCEKPTLPEFNVGEVTQITSSGAIVEVNFISDGNRKIETAFLEYSTKQNFENVLGSFRISPISTKNLITLTGLQRGTTYYIRVNSYNKVGTAISIAKSFTTIPDLPKVNMDAGSISETTAATARYVGASITDNGLNVNSGGYRGVCWSINPNPTITDSKTKDSLTVKSGGFDYTMFNLKPNTKYFARHYAENAAGVTYGKELSFTTDANYSCQTNVIEPNSTVNSVIALANNKIFIHGSFQTINGISSLYTAILNADGTIDQTFKAPYQSGETVGSAGTAILLNGGKILASYTVNGGTSFNLFNSDGTIDQTFKSPNIAGTVLYATRLSDNKFLIIGNFNSVNGVVRNRMVRLNPDGTIDATYFGGNNVTFLSNSIRAGEYTNGKFYIQNTSVAGNSAAGYPIFIINENGTLDTISTKYFENVAKSRQFILQKTIDGKLLCLDIDNNIFKIKLDGTIDDSFKNRAIQGSIASSSSRIIQEKNTGKLYLSGSLTSYDGNAVYGIFRINTDGSLDKSFNPEIGFTSGFATSIDFTTDGKLLIVGNFLKYRSLSARRFIKINSDGSFCN